jgi:precorrin-2 dehydrogenase/sirohydrochlorin ferrochelatase
MYPVNIKMDGRACLVIGGGHVALRKVRTLLEEKATVTVVAPQICSGLEALFREGRISWRRESYEAPMCGSFFMVVTAAGDKTVALSVQEEAERESILYNAADFPALGNCHIPARIKKEGLMVTVSTEGRSPAMAKYVKNWLALEIPDAYGQWLDRMGALRSVLQEGLADAEQREKFWRLAFEHQVMELVVQGNLDAAEERVRSGISRLRSES